MIRQCTTGEFGEILAVINDAASAYHGVIPQDCWHEPYMSADELRVQIEEGVVFWGYEENGGLKGVMGIQDKKDFTLIRHAYVRTCDRNRGIGSRLLEHLVLLATNPVLVGTWADADWAIAFYSKHGFTLVTTEEKDHLLSKYWSIPKRQIETSVVLAGTDF